MQYLQFNDPLHIVWREGSQDDPYLQITESHKIVNNIIILSEIPDELQGVKINDNEYAAIISGDPVGKQFIVDYSTGIVKFNASENGQTVQTFYNGRGIIRYPAERIYVHTEGDINAAQSIQTLINSGKAGIAALGEVNNRLTELRFCGDYSDETEYKVNNSVRYNDTSYRCILDSTGNIPTDNTYWVEVLSVAEEIADVTQAISDTNTAKIEANTARDSANVATQAANTATSEAIAAKDDANTARDEANAARDAANTATSEANNARDEAITARDNANTAAAYADSKALYAKNEGDYAKSVADELTFKGDYSNETAYKVNNSVRYNNALYRCILDSTGNLPIDTTYWVEILSVVAELANTVQAAADANLATENANIARDEANTARDNANTATSEAITARDNAQAVVNSFVSKGAWSNTTAYVANNLVEENGSTFICILDHTNYQPPNATYWQLVARQGTDGTGLVDSVNGKVGVVTIDTGDIAENGNLYYTDARVDVNDNVSASTAHRGVVEGNPHSVTKSEIGLGNVDNTADLAKPISTAVQAALDSKVDTSQVLTNVPAEAVFTDTVYTHTADGGGDISTPLAGATVISKITINNEGHVTNTETRDLTVNDLGFDPSSKADLSGASFTGPIVIDDNVTIEGQTGDEGTGVDAVICVHQGTNKQKLKVKDSGNIEDMGIQAIYSTDNGDNWDSILDFRKGRLEWGDSLISPGRLKFELTVNDDAERVCIYKRQDDTLYLRKTANMPDANGFLTKIVEEYYASNGTTLRHTLTTTLQYDENGVIIKSDGGVKS